MEEAQEKVPETYLEVATEADLKGIVRERYCKFMLLRWPDEQHQCQAGVAKEWAKHFKAGTEYKETDQVGKQLLVRIYKGEL